MQYKSFTADVTAGSANVVGIGTAWLANVAPGDIFTVQDSGVWYQIASVQSNTQLTLAANWGGSTYLGAPYAISRDFTTNYGIPYPMKGDVDTAGVLQRALEKIDQELARIEALIP